MDMQNSKSKSSIVIFAFRVTFFLSVCNFVQKCTHITGFATNNSPSTSSSRGGTSDSKKNNKLQNIFDESYQDLVPNLSSDGIVTMLSSSLSSSSSSSSTRTSPQTNKDEGAYSNDKITSSSSPLRQSMFSSPVIPFIYERILPPLWAAGLRVGGMDKEYNVATSFLRGDGTGIIADISCGTGFMARRFANGGTFDHVVALDYSEEMLSELVMELKRTPLTRKQQSSLSIVRGDAGCLPFQSNSLDAVHWGAAMHCVPDAERAMKEIYRVLKPGGKLYATTFLRPLPNVVFRFFTLEELDTIARNAGFGGVDSKDGGVVRVEQLSPVYGVVKCMK